MERIIKSILCVAMIFFSTLASAQPETEMADTMRSEGKIYVVVGIILVILTGLIVYLVLIDRKVRKLEERISEKK